jgi:site-specific recombinase XerD
MRTLRDFMHFTGIALAKEFRTATRAHVIAWRDDLAARELGGATVRHRLAALSSLFEYLLASRPTGAQAAGVANNLIPADSVGGFHQWG